MKFGKEYLGKWVAIDKNKVIASDKTLTKLTKKLGEKESQKFSYTLIPKNVIAG